MASEVFYIVGEAGGRSVFENQYALPLDIL